MAAAAATQTAYLNNNISSTFPFLKTRQVFFFFVSSSSSSSFVSFPRLTTTSSISPPPLLPAIIPKRTLSVSFSTDNSSSSNAAAAPPPCQLYVCNLPTTCDESQLLHLFKPFGDVQLVQVSRNTDSGLSRGCAFVTMTSIDQAIAALTALDASDFGGREMRVRFSKDLIRENNKYIQVATNKSLIFESPHKLYVGNLAWSIKPHLLKQFFTQFGTVVSVRILYDRKVGKNRVYAFLSFSSEQDLNSALSSHGTELLGRKLVVRNALKTDDPS